MLRRSCCRWWCYPSSVQDSSYGYTTLPRGQLSAQVILDMRMWSLPQTGKRKSSSYFLIWFHGIPAICVQSYNFILNSPINQTEITISHRNHRNHRNFRSMAHARPLPTPSLGIPKGESCYQRDARRGGAGGGKFLHFPWSPHPLGAGLGAG